jgi:NitT/TauT family transport system substrate-binding protein
MFRFFLVALLFVLPRSAFAADAAISTPIRLEVALGDLTLNKLPFLVAADTGIYARHGLEIRQYFTPVAVERARRQGIAIPADYVRADETDDAHITVAGATPTIVGFTRDVLAADRVVIASFESTLGSHIISSASIAAPQDLKGKRLGYSAHDTVSYLAAVLFARQMGWDPHRDISLFANGNNAASVTGGRVDAYVGNALAQSAAAGQNLKDLFDLAQDRIPVAGSGLNAERSWLRDNREAALRFVKATIEAIAKVQTDKPVASAALVKWFNISDPAAQERLLRDVAAAPRAPYPAVAGIRTIMQAYNHAEMNRHRPEDFYDASLVAELDRNGFIAGLSRQ